MEQLLQSMCKGLRAVPSSIKKQNKTEKEEGRCIAAWRWAWLTSPLGALDS